MSSIDNITNLQSAIHSRALSSRDLVSNYLKKIHLLDPHLKAFVEVYEKEALEGADACDQMAKNGLFLSPLHGVPIAVKDIIDIRGKVTTIGSPLFKNVAERSADVVDLLQKAGMIVIGKTHTVQFALGAWGTNENMGTPKNPWSTTQHLTPGGSSSGSAVAVACGMVPLSIGTDTGGSIRIPAAFCGISGLKTTVKRISTQGIAPLSQTLDTVGMFAKDAQGLKDLLNILLSHKRFSPYAFESQTKDTPFETHFPINKLRLGRLKAQELVGVHPDLILAYERMLAKLQEHGAAVEFIDMPFSFESVAKVSSTLMMPQAVVEYGDLAKDPGQTVDSAVRQRLLAGMQITGAQYVQALRDQDRMKKEFLAATAHLDAYLTPSSTTPPQPVEGVNHDRPPVRYTRLMNLLDSCAASIPAGLDTQGLPIGLQLAGRAQEDELILNIAAQIQRITSHHLEYPKGSSFY
jgi:aspartyl-tRNA(Asn)/glutamyl-tRNA(Gln) amidotransferase subunit A